MTVKGFVGAGFKIVIAFVVIAFLGLKSLDFFYFVTPADQWYYAYLGFGLTGGGVIAYLVIFLWDADTSLKKAISIAMLAFCVIGELLSAGFGLQINAWKAGGYQMANSDFESMILVIQLLGFVHAAALIGYVAGDTIIWAFSDDDGDGTVNAIDPVDNRTGQPTTRQKIRFPWQKKEVVRQPQVKLDGFSEQQMMDLAQYIARINAANQQAGQGSSNGQHAPDPTQAARK